MKKILTIIGVLFLSLPLFILIPLSLKILIMKDKIENASDFLSFIESAVNYSSALGPALWGIIILGFVIDGADHKPKWLYKWMIVLGILWCFCYPAGWMIGVSLLVYTVCKRKKFKEMKSKKSLNHSIKLNNIIAKYEKTEYWSTKHPCVFIDGKRLDVIVDEIKPGNKYKGLIPTLFSALTDDKEVDLVWRRVLPECGSSLLPVLMCPDDVELACTLIMTEVTVTQDTVIWKNFGLDMSYDDEEKYPEYIGQEIEWFTQNLRFEFSKNQYIKMIRVFKDEIDLNKNNI